MGIERKKIISGNEIDFLVLFNTILDSRWVILRFALGATCLGLIIAFTSPKEYKASCVLIPETMSNQGNLGGSLGGLASLAGIDIGSLSGGSSTINPGLYRSIASGTPFMIDLMGQKFYFKEEQDSLSIESYFRDSYKVGLVSRVFSLPGRLISLIRPRNEDRNDLLIDDDLISISKIESDIIELLKERILVTMDWELGVVTIEVRLQDPLVTAQVTEFTRKYISSVVQDYSQQKSKEQLEYVEEQLQIKINEFSIVQLKLANFRDANRNVSTSKARTEEERLESEYSIAFNVFNQLAQQRETVKLQLNQSKPTFSILEPVRIPVEKSSPRRGLITVSFFIIGIISALVFVLSKNWILENKLIEVK